VSFRVCKLLVRAFLNTVLQTLELNWIARELLLMFLTDCFGGAQDKNKIQDETKLNTEMRAP